MRTINQKIGLSLIVVIGILAACKKNTVLDSDKFRPHSKIMSLSGITTFESPITAQIVNNSGQVSAVYDDVFTVIADGVDETEINFKDSIGDTIRMFITRVDLNKPGIALRTSTPYDRDLSLNTSTGKNHVQNIKGMGKHIEYKSQKVLAGVNGDFYDVSNNVLRGPLHRGGTVLKSTFDYTSSLPQQALTFMGVRTDGTLFMSEKADYDTHKASLVEASGGGVMLIKNGLVVDNSSYTQFAGEPRTAIGYTASNIVYMIVVDGRQAPYSYGSNYHKLSRIFQSLNAQNAINLDGGGSSTKMIRMPVADSLKIINSPSAGLPRDVAAGWVVVANYQVSTLAGASTYGFVNGTGSTARFRNPDGVVIDPSGNIVVTDRSNHAIRKITTTGVTTTFAGNGVAGYASGTPGQFNTPWQSTYDATGNLIVVEKDGAMVRKVSPTGVVSWAAGSGVQGFKDGAGAMFDNPLDAVVDSYGSIYVVDRNNKRIRKISTGGVVSTFAGDGTSSILTNPLAIAIDPSNNLFVADGYTIKRITPTGSISTIIGNGTKGFNDGTIGQPLTCQLGDIFGLNFDSKGRLFLADASNHRIRKVSPSTTGSWTGAIITTVAGTGTAGLSNGLWNKATFNNPYDVTIDNTGIIYVADNLNNVIRKIAYPQ